MAVGPHLQIWQAPVAAEHPWSGKYTSALSEVKSLAGAMHRAHKVLVSRKGPSRRSAQLSSAMLHPTKTICASNGGPALGAHRRRPQILLSVQIDPPGPSDAPTTRRHFSR